MEYTHDVRTTTLHHECRRCNKIVAPQMMVALFKRENQDAAWKLYAWECPNYCAYDRKPYNREVLAAVLHCPEYELQSLTNSAMDGQFHRGQDHYLVYLHRNPCGCDVLKIRHWQDEQQLPLHLVDDRHWINAYGQVIYEKPLKVGRCP